MTDHTCADLETLAAAFDSHEFATTLLSGDDRTPRLTVISRPARTSHDIYADNGWYWHSWAERITPVSQPQQAAQKIADMLRTTLPPIHRPQL